VPADQYVAYPYPCLWGRFYGGDYCCSGSAQTQIPRMFTTQLVLGLGLVSVGEGEGEGELVPVPGDDGAVGVGLAD
jgi:hypothetical protein